jgi:uncharacterized membrane protein
MQALYSTPSLQQNFAMNKREWFLKRNCSLSPRQFVTTLSILCLGLILFTLPFAVYGAWIILAFAALEIAGLAVAFYCYARHACDHEHIVLADGSLLVERFEADKIEQIRLEPNWVRVVSPKRYGDLIKLESGRHAVQIGHYLTAANRRRFAEELRRELRK